MSDSGSISLFTEEIEFTYPEESKLKEWIFSVLKSEQFTLHYINIIFCSDDFLLHLNKEHLEHDYYTDILTFQYEHEPIEGELFISVDRVRDNADRLEVAPEDELNRVVIHGVLHLMGYKDKSQKDVRLMRQKEDEYLLMFNEMHTKLS